VAFSPDGRLLAFIHKDQYVKVLDSATGQELFTLASRTANLIGLAFSRCGRLAAASADNTIKVWDTRTGQELVTLHGHGEVVWCLAFSPDGLWLASGSHERGLILWDARPVTDGDADQRQALALLEARCRQPVSVDQLADRIGADPTLSQGVRQQALDLAPRYWKGKIRLDADEQVRTLFWKGLPQGDLLEAIRALRDVPEAIRQEALVQAQQYAETPQIMNLKSRDTQRQAGKDQAAYGLALRRAQVACRVSPDNAEYRATLGMAHYRLKEYPQALDQLRHAQRLLQSAGSGPPPALLAFLAMCHQQLGQPEEARRTLEQLHEAMRQPAHGTQEEARAFLGEAEALVAPGPN
jgi:tetratricopeptide (TPR) repeat protein